MLYFSDTLKTSSETKISRVSWDLGIGNTMGTGNRWIWGLNYGSGTFNDTTSTAVTFVFTDMGVKLGYFLTRQKNWVTNVAYNLDSRAKYNNGTTEVELRGTSIKADVGYVFWPTETLGLALKMFYYAPTYKESVATTTLTTVSYNRATIYPSLSIIGSF